MKYLKSIVCILVGLGAGGFLLLQHANSAAMGLDPKWEQGALQAAAAVGLFGYAAFQCWPKR
jgi:hypothetical protein